MAKLRLVGVITFGRHLAHWLATWNKMWKFQFVCSSSQARINSLVINPSNLDSNSPFFNCIFAHTTAAPHPPPSESLQKLKLQRLAEYLPDLKFLTRKLRKVFAMNKKFHFLSDEEKKTNNEKMVSYRTARFWQQAWGLRRPRPSCFFYLWYYLSVILFNDIIHLWYYWMILLNNWCRFRKGLHLNSIHQYLVQSFLAIEPKMIKLEITKSNLDLAATQTW